jgi:ATP-dependent DNA helicase RecQ
LDAEPAFDLEYGLELLGHEEFRPGQRECIESLLSLGRVLLVAPTGGGKSLCYQLPAAILPGTTVVISPLIALMNDQVTALEGRGIPATYLASTLDSDEIRKRMAKMAAGEYKLVYVSPERLTFPGFRGLLMDTEIPLIAVDEAHCISEWGHDFRPEYSQIGETLAQLPPTRVLACTATATPVVRDEILAKLGLGAETPQILRGFARPNLSLAATEYAGRKHRATEVDAMLARALGGPELAGGAAIIYSPTRKQSEAEAKRLGQEGWTAAAYHAGLSAKVRERVQKRFSTGRLDVVVATNAFGMGIDRADVRAVIHLGPPGSVEAYYQEVGRAGRDGDEAWGLLLTTSSDMPLRRRLLEMDVDGGPPDPETIEHKWSLFLELMRWVEGGSCRHDAILRYFGDDAEVLEGCGRCDVCRGFAAEEHDEEEVSLLVRKALSGVARVHGRYGLRLAATLLVGKADERLARAGLDEVRTFGVLSELPEAWIVSLLRRCVTAGWVMFSGAERPVVSLTREGQQVMRGERAARLLLPPRDAARGRSPSARKGGSAAVDGVELDEAGLELFEALRTYRLSRSKTDGIPPFHVASDRSLREVVLLRPRDLSELQLAHGIGPTKAERYGTELLEVVAQFGAQG